MFPLSNHDYSEGEQGSVVMKFTQIVVSTQLGHKMVKSFCQAFTKASKNHLGNTKSINFPKGKTMANPALDRDQMRSILWHNL
jgi:hypothetical protein